MIKIGVCRPRFTRTAVFFTVVFLALPGAVSAGNSLHGEFAVAVTIDAENLIELYHSVQDPWIIESRLYEDFVQGYIETADKSRAAIQLAAFCGYQRLLWFRDGFAEWEDKEYPNIIE